VAIVGLVILAACGLLVVSIMERSTWSLAHLAFWTVVCVLSELLWFRAPTGESFTSLGTSTKLAAAFVCGVWPAVVVSWLSTLIGNVVFRRAPWYKALYNASQLALACAVAAAVYRIAGEKPLADPMLSPLVGLPSVVDILSTSRYMRAVLTAGAAYSLSNTLLMAWLLSVMSKRRFLSLLKENSLQPESLQTLAASILLVPLLVLLYGLTGIIGILVLFLLLGLVLVANRRYLAVVRAQDSLLRTERMAAMGDVAEEIGSALGDYLKQLKERTEALMGMAQGRAEGKILKSADIIQSNVGQMSAMIEGLVAFSHTEAVKRMSDLNELVGKTVEFIRPQNRFDDVEFDIRLDPELGLVKSDPGQIQQVLINLLANAADAMNEAHSDFRRILVQTERIAGGKRVRIKVADSGPGIPKESLPRVFEPHFTTKKTGHGFGLSTAFRIAQNHNGSIQAGNQNHGGAEFLLELPAA